MLTIINYFIINISFLLKIEYFYYKVKYKIYILYKINYTYLIMKSILNLLFLFFTFNFSFSQTVDEIIDMHIKAIGGSENLDKIQTAKIEAVSSVAGFDIPITFSMKKPNNVLLEINVQGMIMKQGYDGNTAWVLNPFQGTPVIDTLKGAEAKNLIRTSDIDGLLYNYSKKGFKAELIGKENIEGAETFNVKLTDADGDFINFYIDTENLMIVKQVSVTKSGEKTITSTSSFSNYKPVENVMIAFDMLLSSSDNPMGQQKIKLSSYIPNVEIDETIFKIPAE